MKKSLLIAALLAVAAMSSANAFPVVVHVAPHVVMAHPVYHPVIVSRPVVIARPIIVAHPIIMPHPVVVVPVQHVVDVCATLTYQQRVAVNAKAGHYICAQ